MNICHFSDSHLGAGESHTKRSKSGLTLRQEDIINSFIETIDRIIIEKPDICLHSGDIFHTVRPTNKIISVAAEQLHRLANENNIPTVIISGNHDAPKQPHIGAALNIFNHIDNLYISAGSGLEIFDLLDARIFALPHCLTTAIQKEELTKCIPDSSKKYNILMMHGVAAGMPEFSMADLGEQELPLDIMNKFDYTALGHYHNYSMISERVYYAGSTERITQSERDHAKGYITVNLEPFKVAFNEIKCRQMVDLTPINARGQRGDQLAKIIEENINKIDSSDKIVRLKVENVSEETLKTLPPDVLNKLRQNSFALDISFKKEEIEKDIPQFGKSAIGQIDHGFIKFLESVNLDGFDVERLKKEALKYLSGTE
jgi:DNA repair exonuclease SbcCD nuclease subunit